jgi:hypothetical protein
MVIEYRLCYFICLVFVATVTICSCSTSIFSAKPGIAPKRKSSLLNGLHFEQLYPARTAPLILETPFKNQWDAALVKLNRHHSNHATGIDHSNIVVYHVDDYWTGSGAVDLTVNNLKSFIQAILLHNRAENQTQIAFYWFNVIGVLDNPLAQLIPTDLGNVAIVHWTHSSGFMSTFIQSLRLFGSKYISKFGAVFQSSSAVRGPLAGWENGRWIADFRTILDGKKVAAVSPIWSCEGRPHLQIHMFAIKHFLASQLVRELDHYISSLSGMQVDDYFSYHLTKAVESVGYSVGSMVHYKRYGLTSITATTCEMFHPVGATGGGDLTLGSGSGSGSCSASCLLPHPSDALFLRWGSEPLTAKGYTCSKSVAMSQYSVDMVQNATLTLFKSKKESNSKPPQDVFFHRGRSISTTIGSNAKEAHVREEPVFPEMPHGGLLSVLYEEQELEDARRAAMDTRSRSSSLKRVPLTVMQTHHADYSAPSVLQKGETIGTATRTAATMRQKEKDSQVCFLVRTSKGQDFQRDSPVSAGAAASARSKHTQHSKLDYVNMDLGVLIKCKDTEIDLVFCLLACLSF